MAAAMALAALLAVAGWLAQSREPSPGDAPRSSQAPLATSLPAPTATPPWSGSVLAAVVPEVDSGNGSHQAAEEPPSTPSQALGKPGRAIALYPVASDDQPRLLIGGFEDIGRLAWSHDGGSLAFSGLRDGNWDIYRVSRDARELLRVTTDPAYDGDPAWSPDDLLIAFTSSRDGNLDLYRVTVTAETEALPQKLTDGDQPAVEPAWSPDGSWIAFAGWADGGYRLEAVGAEGAVRQIVTAATDDNDVRSPTWSIGGDEVLFLASRYGSGTLKSIAWPSDEPENEAADVAPRTGNRPAAALSPGTSQVTSFSRFPGGTAVVMATQQRDGSLIELHDENGRRREEVAVLPPGSGDVAWARGPMPTGLEPIASGGLSPGADVGQAADVGPDADAELGADVGPGLERRPGLVRLPDVDVPGDRINADIADDFTAMRAEVRDAVGIDYLGTLADLWRPLGYSGSSFFSWHKVGRAFDMQMELRGPGGRRDSVLVREDIRGRTYWRMFLRAAAQDGTIGVPLRQPGWTFTAGGGDPAYASEGGRRGDRVPGGYWVDLTAIAAGYGWQRIPSNTRGDLDWRRSWTGIDYWHYERRDGLRWFDAARQVYSDEELQAELDAVRLREQGISLGRLTRLGFPSDWAREG